MSDLARHQRRTLPNNITILGDHIVWRDDHRVRHHEIDAQPRRDIQALGRVLAVRIQQRRKSIPEQRTLYIDNQTQRRIQDALRRAFDLRAVPNRHHIGGYLEVRPLVRLRITRPPQMHPNIHTVGRGDLRDDLPDRLHPNGLHIDLRAIPQQTRTDNVERRFQDRRRLTITLQTLQHGTEVGPHVRVAGQEVVDELPHSRLDTQRLLGRHRLDRRANRGRVDRVRERLRLNRQVPRRPDDQVVQDVVDADELEHMRPHTIRAQLLPVPLDVERLRDTRCLDGDSDHRLRARPEQRHQMVIALQRQRRLRGKVSRDRVRQLNEVADPVDLAPQVVARGDDVVGVVGRERLRQHLSRFGLTPLITRVQVPLPPLDLSVGELHRGQPELAAPVNWAATMMAIRPVISFGASRLR